MASDVLASYILMENFTEQEMAEVALILKLEELDRRVYVVYT